MFGRWSAFPLGLLRGSLGLHFPASGAEWQARLMSWVGEPGRGCRLSLALRNKETWSTCLAKSVLLKSLLHQRCWAYLFHLRFGDTAAEFAIYTGFSCTREPWPETYVDTALRRQHGYPLPKYSHIYMLCFYHVVRMVPLHSFSKTLIFYGFSWKLYVDSTLTPWTHTDTQGRQELERVWTSPCGSRNRRGAFRGFSWDP